MSRFGGQGNQFATGEVFQIRTEKDRTRGGLIGGAIGAGIGLILILVGSDDELEAGEWPAAGAAIGFGGWGAIIGAIRGSRTLIRFGR